MKKISSILLIVYFVALGGGATVLSHYCGGDHITTILNPVSDTGCCSDNDQALAKTGCGSTGCKSAAQDKRHCSSKDDMQCNEDCCDDDVITFRLSELSQSSRILAESPVSLELPITNVRNYTPQAGLPDNFIPAFQITSSPPPGKQNPHSVLAVFLL